MSVHMQLFGIQKSYKSTKALNSVSTELEGNKITVFLGINGAGKTTLMRIMAGLENPDSGKIHYNKQDIGAGELRKVSTLVFQKTAMFSMNVYDNLAYGLKIRNVPDEEISRKIEAALHDVRLSGFEKRKAKKLSGGEQQRIALARSFLLDSNILLLDEPTANLDPNSATIIEKAIVSRKNPQKIIVLSTHNLSQAKRLGDQIVHIHNGEVVETASPQEFFENPKNEITRKFINGELEF
jgi:tungstate transport system ATP-binding protein